MLRKIATFLLMALTLLALPALGEERLAFTEKSMTLYAGEEALLPLNRSPEGVTLTTSHKNVVSVEADGTLVPLKKGTAKIYAAVRGENGKVQRDTLQVTVKQRVTGITAEENLFVPLGQTRNLEAAAMPNSASNRKLIYTSSDESVATVNHRGAVTGKALGECVVTITSEMEPEVTLQCQITVVNPITSIKVEVPKGTSIWTGETYQLTPVIAPSDATYPQVTYESKNTRVATVDQNGLVTGMGRGTATIMVRAADGSRRSYSCRITVKQKPTEIKLKVTEATLKPKQTLRVQATVMPKTTNSTKVEWYSTDPSVASVNQKGRIKAEGVGSCQIVCRSIAFPDVYSVVDVYCLIPMTDITLNADSLVMTAGETFQASYTFEPADATDRPMIWQSGNPAVATVDAAGLITAHAAGNTAVTVQSPDKKNLNDTILITVNQSAGTLTLKPETLTLKTGETKRLHGLITPRNADNNLRWETSDAAVASINPTRATCMLTANKPGVCVITVTSPDGSLTSQCTVTVE
ncbi:MAG: Ig domain-containing protein [Clostridia bacterium]|nr:Ig domain-containing protein [Clostridia bacterium]